MYTIANTIYFFDKEPKKVYFFVWRKLESTLTRVLFMDKKFKMEQKNILFLIKIYEPRKDKFSLFFEFLQNINKDYPNYDSMRDKFISKIVKKKKY